MTNNLRAALWDMDGTLIDSGDDHLQAWVEVLSLEGFHLTPDNFKAQFGRRNDAIITSYIPDCPPDKMERISLEKERIFRSRVRQYGARFLPGAREWVERLTAAGWRQAIATSAPRENAETVLEVTGLQGQFAEIVSAEDVPVGKPDPMVFLVAAQRLGVPPERAIVLEDAPAGIEAAQRAGMKSVGICTLHASLAATLPIQSFADLAPNALDDLLNRA